MECALCGYTASGKFEGDICPQCNLTYWRCSNCKYTITAAKPPGECPSCHQKTDFLNVPPAHDPRIRRARGRLIRAWTN